jgi:hypothetical protein
LVPDNHLQNAILCLVASICNIPRKSQWCLTSILFLLHGRGTSRKKPCLAEICRAQGLAVAHYNLNQSGQRLFAYKRFWLKFPHHLQPTETSQNATFLSTKQTKHEVIALPRTYQSQWLITHTIPSTQNPTNSACCCGRPAYEGAKKTPNLPKSTSTKIFTMHKLERRQYSADREGQPLIAMLRCPKLNSRHAETRC